jgi:hypothetical protein
MLPSVPTLHGRGDADLVGTEHHVLTADGREGGCVAQGWYLELESVRVLSGHAGHPLGVALVARVWEAAISPGLAMGPPACSFRSAVRPSQNWPELGDIEAGIEYRRRVDRPLLPVVADGGAQVVRTAHAQVVAGVAGYEARRRQTGSK